jgi:serine/threonine protein kinase
LGDVVASGGFATIYRAVENGRVEEVAIKLCSQHDDPVYDTSIIKEAELIQRFTHRNIVTLLPIPRHDRASVYHARATELPHNPAFFVMEYLPGGTLNGYLEQIGRLTIPEAAAIGLEVARALDHIHRKGYAHNDLKLENIVFRRPVVAGQPFLPVLVDFGVATRVAPPAAATLYIMSPEQVEQTNMNTPPELAKATDQVKVDVWGLGIVLYRMLGGRLPFEGRSERSLTQQILQTRPTSLHRLSPEISPYLDELIIDGCLAKEPSYRLPLLELGRELSNITGTDSTVVARLDGSSPRDEESKKSKWWPFNR